MRWKIFRVEDGSFVGSDNQDVNGVYIYLVPVLAYADQYLRAMDDLNHCQRIMKKAGLDTSFIRSFRSKK